MAKIDVFDGSDFTMASLTEAANKLPFPPTRIGSMGLFTDRPIMTEMAHVEDRQGKLSLVQTQARGAPGDVISRPKRQVVDFRVPHAPLYATLLAGDIQNIRAFGSETELESASEVSADIMQDIINDLTVTQEYHRAGAVQGIIKDADASTIYNLFTQFNVNGGVRPAVNFDFTAAAQDMEIQCSSVHRTMSEALGATPYSGIVAICGNAFFDSIAANADVRAAYDRFQESEFLRRNKLGPDWSVGASGFMFQDIYFWNYRGQVDTTKFFPDDDCSFVPLGVPGLFIEVLAPPDALSLANTRGQRFYFSQERLKHDKGIEFYGQSNVLPLCTRPACLIEGTGANVVTPT